MCRCSVLLPLCRGSCARALLLSPASSPSLSFFCVVLLILVVVHVLPLCAAGLGFDVAGFGAVVASSSTFLPPSVPPLEKLEGRDWISAVLEGAFVQHLLPPSPFCCLENRAAVLAHIGALNQIGLTPEEVISKIMANPDVALAFQNPKVQAAIMDCSQNPLSIAKYQNDKEVMDVFNKISELFPGVTGSF
ncbi:hypothetical protein KSP39_PZI004503 [Platanthera zijinensis]|uniref:Protein TIC 40, chloroplastic n=1 Tax=Platanthera zijinensis TaxID=2320716 RepID=A0AAP0BY47_9ASPA